MLLLMMLMMQKGRQKRFEPSGHRVLPSLTVPCPADQGWLLAQALVPLESFCDGDVVVGQDGDLCCHEVDGVGQEAGQEAGQVEGTAPCQVAEAS